MTDSDSNYQTDSKALAQVLAAIATPNNGSSSLYSNVNLLTDREYNNIFRKSNLIRKIVSLLPYEAANAGYTVKKTNGDVLSDKNIVISNAFCNAAIKARLYGKTYLVMQTLQDNTKPLKPNDVLISYKIYKDLKLSGDFYVDKQDAKISHKTRTFRFFGNLTFSDCDIDDADYADSILVGLKSALDDFLSSSRYSTKILQNLSNLTIGMRGLGGKLRNAQGKNEIGERLSSFDMNREIDKSIAYDLENEKIDYISQTLTGIPAVIDDLRNIFIANTEYDIGKIFPSQQPAGISSGMQNQLIIRFQWAAQVKQWAETNYLENFYRLYRTIVDDDIVITIPMSLAITDMEQIELEDKAADRNKKLIDSQIITATEARKGYRRSNFDIEIVLDDELPDVDVAKSISNDSKETLLQTDIENVNESLWLALSTITLDDIDKIAKEVLEIGQS